MKRLKSWRLLPSDIYSWPTAIGVGAACGLLALLTAACSLTASIPAPTWTPTTTATASPTPSRTPTPFLTPTTTPTVTDTPSITPPPSLTLLPSATPWPTVAFAGDNWTMAEVPAPLGGPLTEPWVAIVNINDRDSQGDARTPQPQTNVQTLYLVNPRSGQRVALLNLPASVDDRVYWAPTGERVAYFLPEGGSAAAGLYVYDLTIGVSSRLLRLDSLSQRGFFSPPVWSPDGTRLALALTTAYDVDIYLMNADGTDLRPLTDSGAYEVWPVWSPDGQYLAFVSDRDSCPSWRPGDGCFEEFPDGPPGGHLFLMEVASGETRRLSDQLLTEPPYWINERLLGFATGSLLQGDNFRRLWQVDRLTGVARQVALADGQRTAYYLAESWSPDGELVVFQRAGATTDIVLMDVEGRERGHTDQFNFARLAVRAAWSSDGARIALGGHNGQCPHGLVVMTGDLALVSNANPPPTACDPLFSPDGQWIAYSGISPRIDGRLDLYVANANGFSAVNLTASLRGQIRILGWVGGLPAGTSP